MSIRVLFFASLADITGVGETTLEASEFRDVGEIFAKFEQDYPLLRAYQPAILFAVNSEFARPDSAVRDGDEVAFLPPVSGG